MNLSIDRLYRALIAALLLLFSSVGAWAQDGEILDIDIDLDGPEWYERPLVWIGAAAFLLVLAFIVRGRR